jgi:flavin-dependent dehydrogenase
MRSDVISKKKVNLKKLLFEIVGSHPQISQRFQKAILEDAVKGFGLPLGSKKRQLAGDNILLTGDAGSLIDPFTGEGIGNALFSGIYAAEVVMEQLPQMNFSRGSLKKYQERVYHRMGDELRLSRRMQQLVQYPWLFNLVVNKAIANPTLSEMISCMFEDLDMRDRLRKPEFYFKLLFNK